MLYKITFYQIFTSDKLLMPKGYHFLIIQLYVWVCQPFQRIADNKLLSHIVVLHTQTAAHTHTHIGIAMAVMPAATRTPYTYYSFTTTSSINIDLNG